MTVQSTTVATKISKMLKRRTKVELKPGLSAKFIRNILRNSNSPTSQGSKTEAR